MRVAVLMSTYNGEKYLREQVDSILAQEGDFELDLFVRDDGSNDTTIEILKDYEKNNKLKWYSGENLGPAISFLDLLKHVEEYEIYVFSDQDDYWEQGKVMRIINMIGKMEDYCVYFANAQLVNEKLISLGRNVYRTGPKTDLVTLSCAGGILGCTMAFNSSMAEAIKRKDLPKKIVMHDFYVCELCLALNGRIYYDDEPVIKYRQHGDNVVGVSYNKLAAIKERIICITKPAKVGIDVQASEILSLYGDLLSDATKQWLTRISRYKTNLFTRALLAFSRKTHYVNFNNSIKIRLAILFGNR